MSCTRETLPFARGDTSSGGVYTAVAGERPDLLGTTYRALDTTYSTYQPIKLRAVQNKSSATTVARKALAFDTTDDAYLVGKRISGLAGAGAISVTYDPAYAVGQVIPAYDWFLVVDEGPVPVIIANGESVVAGDPLTPNASGLYVKATAGTATAAIAGTAMDTVTGDGTTVSRMYARPWTDQVSAQGT